MKISQRAGHIAKVWTVCRGHGAFLALECMCRLDFPSMPMWQRVRSEVQQDLADLSNAIEIPKEGSACTHSLTSYSS